jgi:tRNA pseudouridine55 synthase
MGRRRKGDIVNGWVNLDKPAGLGSTQAVSIVRRLYNAQKAGHAGTLDPLASGILPIALGEATKTVNYSQDSLKTYAFTIVWGEERTTGDSEGETTAISDKRPTVAEIKAALPQFIGYINQIPPQYSAVKIDGERAYDIARSGGVADIQPREVYIESIALLETRENEADFRCICGKGTYIRSLAVDIAHALGTVGYVANLRREAVGALNLNNSISLDKLREIADSAALDELLLPVETVLDDIPALALNDSEAAKLRNGQKLLFVSRMDFERLSRLGIDAQEESEALATCHGTPVALVLVKGAEIFPLRVLNL